MSRRIVIARWAIPGSPEHAEVEVSYPTVAGIRRAYTVSVQPLTIQRTDTGTLYRYTPSRGYRALVADAPRYSAKQLERYAADPAVLETARDMFARVCMDLGVPVPATMIDAQV